MSGISPDFWNLLDLFWESDKIKRWKNKIFLDSGYPNTGVEACSNLICLSPNAHLMWSHGIFALKPLELTDNDTRFVVRFFWQPRPDHNFEDFVDLVKEPPRSDNLNSIGKDFWLCCLNNDGTCKNIQSGQTFSLHTNDPTNQPLPSWDLIEMQWTLQRLVRMSGAAEWEKSLWNDDSTLSLTSDSIDNQIGSSFENVME